MSKEEEKGSDLFSGEYVAQRESSGMLRGFIAQHPLERRVGCALLETLQPEPSGRQRQTSEEP
jgi:hypothetical protein